MNYLVLLIFTMVNHFTIFDFNTNTNPRDWKIVDDGVMGGISKSIITLDQDGNGIVDHPEYNVWDAYEIYNEMMGVATIPVDTDRVRHAWKGDWNHFNNGATGAVYYTEDSHYVWIPNGTERLEATLSAAEFELETVQAGQLQLSIDLGEDGSNDAQGQGSRVAD